MSVTIVAGLSLKNLKPYVWNPQSPYYLPNLEAVMVSYADFHRMRARRRKAMNKGLHEYLGVPNTVQIYLDNGAFYFLRKGEGEVPRDEYEEFVEQSKPDWHAIPQDYIPSPKMSDDEQLACLRRTMQVNRNYQEDGFVPIIHISRHMDKYLEQLQAEQQLLSKQAIGLGGIVPNLLRAPKAMPYSVVLDHVYQVRAELPDHELHVFGIGGTATLHLAYLLNVDSVDSAGWRNRAAHGTIQLPGRGDRVAANLGSWRGREPTQQEWDILAECKCPACQEYGIEGLQANKMFGFCNRATHNLWILLEEARQIESHLSNASYDTWYTSHVENSIYKPLIDYALERRQQ